MRAGGMEWCLIVGSWARSRFLGQVFPRSLGRAGMDLSLVGAVNDVLILKCA